MTFTGCPYCFRYCSNLLHHLAVKIIPTKWWLLLVRVLLYVNKLLLLEQRWSGFTKIRGNGRLEMPLHLERDLKEFLQESFCGECPGWELNKATRYKDLPALCSWIDSFWPSLDYLSKEKKLEVWINFYVASPYSRDSDGGILTLFRKAAQFIRRRSLEHCRTSPTLSVLDHHKNERDLRTEWWRISKADKNFQKGLAGIRCTQKEFHVSPEFFIWFLLSLAM